MRAGKPPFAISLFDAEKARRRQNAVFQALEKAR
jgi:hypothetical protein